MTAISDNTRYLVYCQELDNWVIAYKYENQWFGIQGYGWLKTVTDIRDLPEKPVATIAKKVYKKKQIKAP